MTDVKICGLSERETLMTALDCGAAYTGFMFYGPSPRNIDLDTARELAEIVEDRAQKVAVTVDASDHLLDSIAAALRPDFVQAHGSETARRIEEISRKFGVGVIKAIKVRGEEDVQLADEYRDCADLLLFDSKAAPGDSMALPGGNGVAFDWTLLKDHASKTPFMLSGGLDAGNVAKAIAVTGAPVVDVSSGVETAPGAKDSRLIANFIEAARREG